MTWILLILSVSSVFIGKFIFHFAKRIVDWFEVVKV
jgi:hypothetical protein